MITRMCTTPTLVSSGSNTTNIAHTKTKYIRTHISRLLAILLATAVIFFLGASPLLAATGEDVIDKAEEYLGYPYAYQASGPYAFDCGGFVWYVFDQAGVDFELRINSADLAEQNLAIYNANDLEIGDIIFFGANPQSIYHWGIYAGGGQVIHSYNESTGVTYTPLDKIIPGFCYAARLTNLLGCNYDYSAELVESSDLPPELSRAAEVQLIPKAFRYGYDENITLDEMSALIYNLCEVMAGVNTRELLADYDLELDALAALWQDPLALASRTLEIAEELPDQMLLEDAVAYLFVELFKEAKLNTIAPEVVQGRLFAEMPIPGNTDDETATVIIVTEDQIAESLPIQGDPLNIIESTKMYSEETIYTRSQAFLTMQRVYDILIELPQ